MDRLGSMGHAVNEIELASIVASRICHDLISPVGAIGNGIELLSASGGAGEEEMALIAECAETASATLQFQRIAFGYRSDEEAVAVSELARVSTAYFRQRRVSFDWGVAKSEALLFGPAKILMLLAMAGASVAPFGGQLSLAATSAAPFRLAWRITADRVKPHPRMLELFTHRPLIADITPGDVHVMLLWLMAERRGVQPFWREEDGGAIIGVE